VQWVGRRCCAAGYDGRAAARPYRLGYVLIIIGKWYDTVCHFHANFCGFVTRQEIKKFTFAS
jgi:hypothetical protein